MAINEIDLEITATTPIATSVDLQVGPRGLSSYESYVATTADDPVLSEAAWAAGGNSVTSSTTSDGTGNLSFASVTIPVIKAAGAAGLDIKNADGASLLRVGVDYTGTGGSNTGVEMGQGTTASGNYSHAEGFDTTASGVRSHSEGTATVASGNSCHAEGLLSVASGAYSHAGGRRAKAIHAGTFVRTDSQDADCESTLTDQATFRFLNGYRFLGGTASFSQVEATQAGIGTATLHPNYLILSNNDGSASAQIYADQIASTSKIFLLPNASGTIALTSDITGTNSGTNTGDETASRIAALIAGTTNKATPADSDKLGYVTAAGGLVYALWSEIKTWLGTWLDAVATIAGAKTASGAWSFTSTTRPTSSGTGTPSDTSLITATDSQMEELWSVGAVHRMVTTTIITTATGNAAASQLRGFLTLNSGSNAGSGIGHIIWSPSQIYAGGSSYGNKLTDPLVFSFSGVVQFNAGSTNKVRFWFSATNTINLADAAEPIANSGIGIEFWLDGTTRKVRLFYRKDNATASTYSSTYDLDSNVATPLFEEGFLFESDGVNIKLYWTKYTTGRRISSTPVISWDNAIVSAPTTRGCSLYASSVHPSSGQVATGTIFINELAVKLKL